MQLREPHALGVLDDHERGVRHVHAHLDDGGRHQQLNLALLEAPHGALLGRRRHASVHHRDRELGQRRRERRRGLFGGLVGHLLGFVDQRTHPIGLPAREAGRADAHHDLVAARLGKRHGGHRRAAGRQLVDHRYVEIRVGGHRERARYGRRGHDQLMRLAPVVGAFLAQRQALMHAEAVLLVDDRERERGELHALLKQRVRADDERRAAVAQLAGAPPRATCPSAGRWRARPRSRAARTSGENCARAGRRAAPSAPSARPDDRVSMARVAASAATSVLPQPTSPCMRRSMGFASFEIRFDLREHPHLRLCRPKRQRREQPALSVPAPASGQPGSC